MHPSTEVLVEALRDSVSVGSAERATAPNLRSLKEKLDDYLTTTPIDVRCIPVFSACTLLDHLLTMLTGEVRYERESADVVDSVFARTGLMLTALADVLNDPAQEGRFQSAYGDLVIAYLSSLRAIDLLVAEGR